MRISSLAKGVAASTFISISLALLPAQLLADTERYWIDDLIDRCDAEDDANRHRVIAYSSAGYAQCRFDRRSLENAKRAAIRACNAYVPSSVRQIAPCVVVYEDGVVTNELAIRNERADTKIPMSFEIFDAVSNATNIYDGFLIYGKLTGNGNVKLSLVYRDGRQFCEGTFKLSKIRDSSKVICFKKYQFIGKNVSNMRFIRLGGALKKYYDVDFEYKGSYIKARLRTK